MIAGNLGGGEGGSSWNGTGPTNTGPVLGTGPTHLVGTSPYNSGGSRYKEGTMSGLVAGSGAGGGSYGGSGARSEPSGGSDVLLEPTPSLVAPMEILMSMPFLPVPVVGAVGWPKAAPGAVRSRSPPVAH